MVSWQLSEGLDFFFQISSRIIYYHLKSLQPSGSAISALSSGFSEAITQPSPVVHDHHLLLVGKVVPIPGWSRAHAFLQADAFHDLGDDVIVHSASFVRKAFGADGLYAVDESLARIDLRQEHVTDVPEAVCDAVLIDNREQTSRLQIHSLLLSLHQSLQIHSQGAGTDDESAEDENRFGHHLLVEGELKESRN